MEWENRRRTQMNAIHRNYQYVKSGALYDASIAALKVRKGLIEKNYQDLIAEHKDLMQRVSKARFEELDKDSAHMETMYIDIIAVIDERIEVLNDVEKRSMQKTSRDATIESDSGRSASVESRKEPHSTTNMSDPMKKAPLTTKAAKKVYNEKQTGVQISEDELEISVMERLSDMSDSESAEITKVRSQVSKVVYAPESDDLTQRWARLGEDAQRLSNETNARLTRTTENNRERYQPIQVSRNVRRNYSAPYAGPPRRTPASCNNCQCMHVMKDCPQLLRLSKDERWKRVRQLNVCQNCFMILYRGPGRHRCQFGNCKLCNEFHNSRLCYYSNV